MPKIKKYRFDKTYSFNYIMKYLSITEWHKLKDVFEQYLLLLKDKK